MAVYSALDAILATQYDGEIRRSLVVKHTDLSVPAYIVAFRMQTYCRPSAVALEPGVNGELPMVEIVPLLTSGAGLVSCEGRTGL